MKMISDQVDATSWRDNGGVVGSMTELGGVLIVTQTPENRETVRLLLDALARANSAADFSPRMTGKTMAVFNVRPLIRLLEARRLDVPAIYRTGYIKGYVNASGWDVLGRGDLFFLGGDMVVKWPANIPLVEKSLEDYSRELTSSEKPKGTP